MFLNVTACYYTYGYAVYLLRCTLGSKGDAKAFMKVHNTVGSSNTRRSKT